MKFSCCTRHFNLLHAYCLYDVVLAAIDPEIKMFNIPNLAEHYFS